MSMAYLSLLRHYAAKVDAELDRVDDLIRRDLELGRQPDWLEAYFDLRIPVEVLALALWGLVTDPRLPLTSSPNPAETSSPSPAD
ncbi:MAG TPA: hypothetical protein VG298_14920 [Acidimicrobiales bacterium]|nr:hypothetical protein [Acidimicrobiales bacterium]